eukprot:jgi/Chlat1/7251/Chrsp58S06903
MAVSEDGVQQKPSSKQKKHKKQSRVVPGTHEVMEANMLPSTINGNQHEERHRSSAVLQEGHLPEQPKEEPKKRKRKVADEPEATEQMMAPETTQERRKSKHKHSVVEESGNLDGKSKTATKENEFWIAEPTNLQIQTVADGAQPREHRKKQKRKRAVDNATASYDNTNSSLQRHIESAVAEVPTTTETQQQKREKQRQTRQALVSSGNDVIVPARKKRQPSTLQSAWLADLHRKDAKHGRFSKEEDKKLAAALQQYVMDRELGAEGYEAVLKTRSNTKYRGAWLEIAKALPRRTAKACWAHARRAYDPGNYQGKWTQEQDGQLLALFEQHGNAWLKIGQELGRAAPNCRDRWRDIRVGGKKLSKWTHEEDVLLTQLVKQSIRAQRTVQGEELADDADINWKELSAATNINWDAIAARLGSRTHGQCLRHCLMQSGADDEGEVPWDTLLPNMSGGECRNRWRTLKQRSGTYTLSDSLDVLLPHYVPALQQDLVEAVVVV